MLIQLRNIFVYKQLELIVKMKYKSSCKINDLFSNQYYRISQLMNIHVSLKITNLLFSFASVNPFRHNFFKVSMLWYWIKKILFSKTLKLHCTEDILLWISAMDNIILSITSAMVEETLEDLVLYSLWFILINEIFM